VAESKACGGPPTKNPGREIPLVEGITAALCTSSVAIRGSSFENTAPCQDHREKKEVQ
jgi:hypothetical protein